MEPITFKVKKCQTPSDFSASFSLQLIGSLPVHSLTTMSMLPWIVAEIRMLSTKSSKEEPSISQIRLYISPASLRCEPDTGKIQQWDPLICSSLFEYKPQQVHKLIHNSHDPSYFACLIKDGAAKHQSICYVFKADDQTKVSKKTKKKEATLSIILQNLLSIMCFIEYDVSVGELMLLILRWNCLCDV